MARHQSAPPPYSVELEEKHWKELESWGERRLSEVMALLRDHVSQTPTTHVPGRLKQLRGEYRGYYQLSIGREHRLIYRVDEEDKKILVEYVGPHPDWSKSRGGRITR